VKLTDSNAGSDLTFFVAALLSGVYGLVLDLFLGTELAAFTAV